MSKLMIQDEQDYDLREVSIRIPYSAEYYDMRIQDEDERIAVTKEVEASIIDYFMDDWPDCVVNVWQEDPKNGDPMFEVTTAYVAYHVERELTGKKAQGVSPVGELEFAEIRDDAVYSLIGPPSDEETE